MSRWMRLAVLVVAGLLAFGLVVGCGSPPPVKKTTKKRKIKKAVVSAPNLDDGGGFQLPPASQIMQKCAKMHEMGNNKDLEGIKRLMDECLNLDRAYAGDIYTSAMASVGDYIFATNPTGAERRALFQQKIDYANKALAAYQAPGAKTNKSATIESLIDKCKMSIDMAQREMGSGK